VCVCVCVFVCVSLCVNAVCLCVSAYLCFFLVGTFVTDFGKNVKKIAEAEMEKTMAALHLWSKGGSVYVCVCVLKLCCPSLNLCYACMPSLSLHLCMRAPLSVCGYGCVSVSRVSCLHIFAWMHVYTCIRVYFVSFLLFLAVVRTATMTTDEHGASRL